VAGGTFRLADVRRVVDAVSRNARYPLASADALETALGGPDATVELGAERHKASEVREIPPDYFPIESSEDLFTKLAALRSEGGDRAEGMAAGQQRSSPPADAGPPPQIPDSDIPKGRNVPSVRGYKR